MGKGDERQDMILLDVDGAKILKSYGNTDSSILCRKCDDEILGKYENDFKEVWERIFKDGEIHPINKDGSLIGWVKEINGRDDIIKTKLFILCCLWRASISSLSEQSLKLGQRREAAIRRELLRKEHKNLLYEYDMLCARYEDGDPGIAVNPYRTNKNSPRKNLCYVHLPYGFSFVVTPGTGNARKKLDLHVFGASSHYFFIANVGKVKNSKAETALFRRTLSGVRSMYASDKKRIKHQLLQTYNDLTEQDIDRVFQ